MGDIARILAADRDRTGNYSRWSMPLGAGARSGIPSRSHSNSTHRPSPPDERYGVAGKVPVLVIDGERVGLARHLRRRRTRAARDGVRAGRRALCCWSSENKNYSSWSLRPWIAAEGVASVRRGAHSALPAGSKERILGYSPRARCVLRDGDTVVWTRSRFSSTSRSAPQLWPTDRAERAQARAMRRNALGVRQLPST